MSDSNRCCGFDWSYMQTEKYDFAKNLAPKAAMIRDTKHKLLVLNVVHVECKLQTLYIQQMQMFVFKILLN